MRLKVSVYAQIRKSHDPEGRVIRGGGRSSDAANASDTRYLYTRSHCLD